MSGTSSLLINMQYSSKYIAYRKMLERRRLLWLVLLVGMPVIMFGLVFFSGSAGAFITFPILLLLFLLWKYFWSQNDICPWCRKSFSEGWRGNAAKMAASGELQCANCGNP
jgi:uncharacterized membrane protein YfcA